MAEVPFTLPGDPAREAAAAAMASPSPILVCTGFPVRGRPETDGPPGAVVLMDALLVLGRPARFASYTAVLDAIRDIRPGYELVDVPTGAEDRPAKLIPDVNAVTVEVCGATAEAEYLNMRGVDIREQAPIFENVIGAHSLISVGDKGNEFGMGSAPDDFFARTGVKRPCSTTSHLVPAAVSNYGAYAIVREMEKLAGVRLLPDTEDHIALIAGLVKRGFVDGHSGEQILAVDGENLDFTREALRLLRR